MDADAPPPQAKGRRIPRSQQRLLSPRRSVPPSMQSRHRSPLSFFASPASTTASSAAHPLSLSASVPRASASALDSDALQADPSSFSSSSSSAAAAAAASSSAVARQPPRSRDRGDGLLPGGDGSSPMPSPLGRRTRSQSVSAAPRSEERRVGKEGRSRGS